MTEFDEIAVGVAQVDALHRTAAAVTRDGAKLNARTFCQELLLHLLDILVHDKAEVQTAALRMARRRQELRRIFVVPKNSAYHPCRSSTRMSSKSR